MSLKLSERKNDLPQFKELFMALFRINDAEVVRRVLNAINNIEESRKENLVSKKMLVDQSTQTCLEDFEIQQIPIMINSEHEEKDTKRRKRKRQRGPRVEKSTEEKKVFIKFDQDSKRMKKANETMQSSKTDPRNSSLPNSIPEAEFLQDIINFDDTHFEEMLMPLKTEQETYLLNQMKFEYNTCNVYSEEGFLPIHDALTTGNLNKLKRQLHVLKFLGIDLTNIFVRDTVINLLHFAIMRKCQTALVKQICETGANFNLENDEDENNLFHLAIEYLDEKEHKSLLHYILQKYVNHKANLKYFEEKNCNGETVFHLCVKRNKPIFFHKMLAWIDSLEENKTSDLEMPNITQEILIDYYNKALRTDKLVKNGTNFKRSFYKNRIVNCKDLRHGFSPLIHAVQNKNELMIKILLHHSADVEVKSFSGLSCLDFCENESKLSNLILDYKNMEEKII